MARAMSKPFSHYFAGIIRPRKPDRTNRQSAASVFPDPVSASRMRSCSSSGNSPTSRCCGRGLPNPVMVRKSARPATSGRSGRTSRPILATIALADHPMSTAEVLTNDHRHHLVCLACGMVGDFIPSRRVEASIRAEARRLLNTIGFDASIHIFDVQDRCNRCR